MLVWFHSPQPAHWKPDFIFTSAYPVASRLVGYAGLIYLAYPQNRSVTMERGEKCRRIRGVVRQASIVRFQNIQCYDRLKLRAVLHWIDGMTHDGSAPALVPNIFATNFQAVSMGEKLVEKSISSTRRLHGCTGNA
jgi:hypothetical protein